VIAPFSVGHEVCRLGLGLAIMLLLTSLITVCAAMLALLGGLLLCRARTRRSRGAAGTSPRHRKRRDLFVVYADDDETWVTGTLLDEIMSWVT